MSKKSESRDRMSRRTLFKSGLMVLGASLIVQPSGAVFGAQDAPKTDIKAKTDAKTDKGKTTTDTTAKHKTTTATHKGSKTHKGTHKITTDTPKKEGS